MKPPAMVRRGGLLSAVVLLVLAAQVAGAQRSRHEITRFMWHGREIAAIRVGPGLPPPIQPAAAKLPPRDRAAGVNTLPNVPAYDWCYGCSATSAAMIVGYYDYNLVYPDLYRGPADGGVCPLDNSVAWAAGESPLSATHMGYDGLAVKGHVDDYWIANNNPGPDPYIAGAWTEHTWADCTGDYMGTNQSKYANNDGSTTFFFWTNGDPLYDYSGSEPAKRDGCHGWKQFVESRGYTVTSVQAFTQLCYPNALYTAITHGFTFDDYKSEIDHGRPVLIQLDGHTMAGFGYDDTGQTVYVRDTWDHAAHTMTWGASYGGMDQWGVTCLQLEVAPRLEWAGTTGYESDGVDPGAGDPNSTTFTFRVKYTDLGGSPPEHARCYIQRHECGDGWSPCRVLGLTKESGDIATGAIYSGSMQLANLVLKHRFHFTDSHGAEVGGDPATYSQAPLITGNPSVCWTGGTGFETDGVDPESGPLGTNFKFQVQYADSAGDAPTTCRLLIRRDGRIFRQKTMAAAPSGDLRLGQVYRTSVTLTKWGTYEYRFNLADASGNALGPPNNWTSGPTITGASSAGIASLAAVPTTAGAQVTFSLASAANVTATVVNVAGRPIRTIAADKPLEAGLRTLLWDRRAESGLAAPAGLYLIRLTVRSAGGGQSTALATVALR
jgi:hypothetical protein